MCASKDAPQCSEPPRPGVWSPSLCIQLRFMLPLSLRASCMHREVRYSVDLACNGLMMFRLFLFLRDKRSSLSCYACKPKLYVNQS